MLSEAERALLDLEREWWQLGGRKDAAITERLGMSASRYYRLREALIARPEAFAYDPMTVLRLRKRRDQARRERIEGRRADPGSR